MVDLIGDKVYDTIKNESLKSRFPRYLAQLLEFTGYDNTYSISKLNDSKIEALEEYARKSNLPELLTDEEAKTFYGLYYRKRALFKLPEGHKELLNVLITDCRQVISNEEKSMLDSSTSENKGKKRSCTCDSSADQQVKKSSTLDLNVENHVCNVTKNYIKTFSALLIQEDRDDLLKRAQNLIVKVIKGKVTLQCPLCIFTSVAYEKKLSEFKSKWVLSNFNKHLKTHYNLNEHRKGNKKSVQKPMNENCSEKPMKQSKLNSFFNNNSFTNDTNKTLCTVNAASTSKCFIYLPEAIQLEDSHIIDSNEGVSAYSDMSKDLTQIDTGLFSEAEKGNDATKTYENCAIKIIAIDSITSDTSNGDIKIDENFRSDNKENELDETFWNIKRKISRTDREHTNLLLSFDNKQSLITDFYGIIKNINHYLDQSTETTTAFEIINSDLYKKRVEHKDFLNLLKTTAENNASKRKHGNSFADPLKLFSLYLYIVGGKLLYETLYSNLKGSLPSMSVVHRTLDNECNVLEGTVNFEGLNRFLEKGKYPKNVFISEDQTAIVKRVRYDSKTDKMVGFTMPLSKKTGFPNTTKFFATSVETIEKSFRSETLSCNAYVFMAQPLVDKAPSFCLCIFGSDNRFTFDDVHKRWKYLETLAKAHDITIDGFSSDGDTRCLKAMRIHSSLPKQEEFSPYSPYFKSSFNPNESIVVQDVIHIATKIKTRITKPNILLPIGHYKISCEHIEEAMNKYSKDRHGLVKSLLNNADKMNFEAIDKLSSYKVIDLLEHINESDATRKILTLTRYIIDAFLDRSLEVERRVYLIWYSVFFIRIWRAWLKENSFSVVHNCLTLNTYTCIEINAHSILVSIEKYRQTPECFLPWYFSSQSCENIFRQTRSMTTCYSTIVNFDMLDILHRLKRIQTLNEITNDLDETFIFPREDNKKKGVNITKKLSHLPPAHEIKTILDTAYTQAIEDAKILGMSGNCLKGAEQVDIFNFHTDENKEDSEDDEVDRNDEQKEESILYSSDISDDESILTDISFLDIKDFSGKNSIDRGKYLDIDIEGKKMTVKKSTLCWLFSADKNKLSSDRLNRVKGMSCSRNTSHKTSVEKIDIQTENYYAVFYDANWYIGRVIHIDAEYCSIKFLENFLDSFKWPSRPDIQQVQKQFIFHGPIQLIGNGPFIISENMKNMIKKKYSLLKKQ